MNTLHPQPVPDLTDVTVEDEVVTSSPARMALAALRIAFGLTFLWAFFDKLLALGYHTGYDQEGNLDRFGDAAWINGGSPTEGFFTFGVNPDSPFASFFNNLAGYAVVDWLFMLGLLAIGLTLTLGVGIRLGAIAGFAMYLFMYAAVMVPENNPVFDDHLIGAISMVGPGLHPGRGHLGPRQGLGEDPPGAPVRHPPLTLHCTTQHTATTGTIQPVVALPATGPRFPVGGRGTARRPCSRCREPLRGCAASARARHARASRARCEPVWSWRAHQPRRALA